jgi:hypothetical protein
MSASPAPSLSGRPGDRRDGPSGSGLRPHRRGVPSGRSLPAPIRRPGRFPETPGPRPEDRPRSADPCLGDRSLRGTSSLRAMPAAARRLILASQGHARTGSLRFFDPLPPHVGLSRLLREAWRARGRLPPASDPAPGPSPGVSRGIPGEATRIRPPRPDGRLDPGGPAVDSLTLRGIPPGIGVVSGPALRLYRPPCRGGFEPISRIRSPARVLLTEPPGETRARQLSPRPPAPRPLRPRVPLLTLLLTVVLTLLLVQEAAVRSRPEKPGRARSPPAPLAPPTLAAASTAANTVTNTATRP